MEYLLRACILDCKGSWSTCLLLIEFAYNKRYQSSIGMIPYEALYESPYRSALCWIEVWESKVVSDCVKSRVVSENWKTNQTNIN